MFNFAGAAPFFSARKTAFFERFDRFQHRRRPVLTF
jgi:hypothetical protein